ncbi:MAG: hypothetical protein KF749_16160 [Bacteroidetes bacterium]|nr:hypothetical protein [Bacteroidota bacterium]MCW5896631.1 hypothetical protein [Bacteroidota bacterium]
MCPNGQDTRKMLNAIGVGSLDEIIDQSVPAAVRSKSLLPLTGERSNRMLAMQKTGQQVSLLHREYQIDSRAPFHYLFSAHHSVQDPECPDEHVPPRHANNSMLHSR